MASSQTTSGWAEASSTKGSEASRAGSVAPGVRDRGLGEHTRVGGGSVEKGDGLTNLINRKLEGDHSYR